MEQIIGGLIILVLIHKIFKYNYKECKTDIQRLGVGAFYAICLALLFIFFMDRYNVPTYLELGKNVDTQTWLEIINNYSVGIGSALISGVLLVIVTKIQIERNNEDTIKRDAESIRIQNIPILKYTLNAEKSMLSNTENFIKTKYEEGNTYYLNICIKNVGLNNIKSIKIDIESSSFKESIKRIIGQNSIIVMEKSEKINIGIYFTLKYSEQPYKMNLKLYYQDVLGNWYSQVLDIDYIATNIGQAGYHQGQVKYIVNEEKLLDTNHINNL